VLGQQAAVVNDYTEDTLDYPPGEHSPRKQIKLARSRVITP